MTREIEMVRVADVVVGARHRMPTEESTTDLAESMRAIGLQNPIHVRYVEEVVLDDGEVRCGVPVLVAGAHRLAAAKELGWEKIEAIAVDLDETDAEIWEIDENLARAELTTEQKRQQLRRRKALWEERKKREAKESGALCATLEKPQTGRGNMGFAAETAAATGLSKSQINRLLADPKPKPVLPTGGIEVREYVSPQDASDKRVEAVWGAYLKLTYDERQRFRDRMEENEPAIFDTTPAGRAA